MISTFHLLQKQINEMLHIYKMNGKITVLSHIVQKYHWDCGIACIRMILSVNKRFDESVIYGVLNDLDIFESTWTIDLVHILHHFGIDCEYYTVTCGVDPNYKNETYYKCNFSKDEHRVSKLFDKASDMGWCIIKRSLSIEEILFKLNDGYVAITLVNSLLLNCKWCTQKYLQLSTCVPRNDAHTIFNVNDLVAPYEGHYIIVCGHDVCSGSIFYKNPSLYETECCIDKSIFDEARKSYGTDEDIVFIKL